jgi:hypothetical protein
MPRAQPERHHPVALIFRYRGETWEHVAPHVGVTPQFLRLVCCGHQVASPRLRRLLAAYFDLPERVCFHDDTRDVREVAS